MKTKINKKLFDWDAAINEIWKEEHETLMDTLEKKWRHFAEEWLESDAGKGFQIMLDASKYVPSVLSSDPDCRASKFESFFRNRSLLLINCSRLAPDAVEQEFLQTTFSGNFFI